MDFKKATDALFAGISHSDLAKALGVSVAAIRQARLSASANAYRMPPEGWEKGAAVLAKKRAALLARLADQLDDD